MQPISVELWYAALAEPQGIVVQIEGDIEKARQRLYALRRQAQDADLEKLSLVIAPSNPQQLWIVKRS